MTPATLKYLRAKFPEDRTAGELAKVLRKEKNNENRK
jgi:hypothetical protein